MMKYYCFCSNKKYYIHTPKKDIPTKDVWEAGKLLRKLRADSRVGE